MISIPMYGRPISRVVATALALTIALQAGIALGGPTISSIGGPPVIGPALAALNGPPGCTVATFRTQKDNFAWAGSNAYRLHGWLFYDEAYFVSDLESCLWRQWHYGEDSRNCDGCAFKAVSTQTVHGKYWVCGPLLYDSTLTQFNVALTTLTPGVWENYGGCGPQASLSGHQDKAGVFSYDYFLNY